MKNYFRILFVAISLLAIFGSASAQNSNRQRMSREQFAQVRARHIADSLGLANETYDQFVKTYCDQQKEIWALGPRITSDSASSKPDAKEAIQKRFEKSQKILDIRQKYYKEYSKFMTQEQIQKMYELERNFMGRMSSQRASKGRIGRRGRQHAGNASASR
jgi:hypothetical protein